MKFIFFILVAALSVPLSANACEKSQREIFSCTAQDEQNKQDVLVQVCQGDKAVSLFMRKGDARVNLATNNKVARNYSWSSATRDTNTFYFQHPSTQKWYLVEHQHDDSTGRYLDAFVIVRDQNLQTGSSEHYDCKKNTVRFKKDAIKAIANDHYDDKRFD